MKAQIRSCLFVVLLLGPFLSAKALQGSPQAALEELATAEKFEDFVKHLPAAVEEHVAKLPKQDREALAEKLMITKSLLHDGSTLTHTGANSWDVVQKSDGDKRTFTFKNTYTAGDTALVELEITDKHPTQTLLIRMRLEKDEWRIQNIGQWQAADVAQELLRTERRMEQSDPVQPAAAALRTMNTALLTYYVTYESQGFPMTLQALSGKENDPMTPDQAGLLDPSYLQEPISKAGQRC